MDLVQFFSHGIDWMMLGGIIYQLGGIKEGLKDHERRITNLEGENGIFSRNRKTV